MASQVPSADREVRAMHESHSSVQASLQQTPSAQYLDMHSTPLLQGVPFGAGEEQVMLESQKRGARHVSSVIPRGTGRHSPSEVPTLHASHVPLQGPSQQYPSTQ